MSAYVYFIEAKNLGLTKIGMSQDVKKRMKDLREGPDELILHEMVRLSSRVEAYRVENNLHKQLQNFRVRGEWFGLTPEHREQIIQQTTPLSVTRILIPNADAPKDVVYMLGQQAEYFEQGRLAALSNLPQTQSPQIINQGSTEWHYCQIAWQQGFDYGKHGDKASVKKVAVIPTMAEVKRRIKLLVKYRQPIKRSDLINCFGSRQANEVDIFISDLIFDGCLNTTPAVKKSESIITLGPKA